MPTGGTSETSAAPDWSQQTRDVFCPLCEYNLRGLIDPRCPECGHRFTWPDVLDPHKGDHPFLFEHYPKRNFWSFWKTSTRTMLPGPFWHSLEPTHRFRPRRLLIYWTICAMLAALPLAISAGVRISDAYSRTYYISAWVSRKPPPVATWLADNLVDPALWKDVLLRNCLAVFAIPALAWPIVTLLTLMIFQASMRRKRIKTLHLLRCVIYSADVFAWGGVALLLLIAHYLLLTEQEVGQASPLPVVLLTCACTLKAGHRLALAYQNYLKFDHPIATAVASQTIVLLLAILVVLQAYIAQMFW